MKTFLQISILSFVIIIFTGCGLNKTIYIDTIYKTYKSSKSYYKKHKVNKPKNQITILVDPGHGGKDPGAIGINGLKEKDLNFKVAVKVKNMLKKQGFNVRMTRWFDKFQPLSIRASYANKHDVDLLVSIHGNSAPKWKAKRTSGIETFYYRNSNTSKEAASLIQKHLLEEVRSVMGKRTIKSRGSKGHGFYVLRKSDMPAILVELGFLSHPLESKRLSRDSYQDLLAKGISKGITEYFE